MFRVTLKLNLFRIIFNHGNMLEACNAKVRQYNRFLVNDGRYVRQGDREP